MTRSRISYVNGRYVRHDLAKVHIEDRGYQFSDGVYEVIGLKHGKLLDPEPHLTRLKHSLEAISITFPTSMEVLYIIMYELIRQNRMCEGSIYIQITRGVASRNHSFPKKPILPSVVVTVEQPKCFPPEFHSEGVGVISYPDIRWNRPDIKSISLLGGILAKQEAVKAQVCETILLGEGDIVREGSSSNFFIVDNDDVVCTHPESPYILGGVTRKTVLALAKEEGFVVKEEPFTLEEAKHAKEAFLTSTYLDVMPVVKIDDHVVGSGKPGNITATLMSLYGKHVREC